MKRILLFALVLLSLLPMGSCNRGAGKLSFDGIERVRLQGLTSVEVVAHITNDTGHKLALDGAEVAVFYQGRRIATVLLLEGLKMDAKSSGSLSSQWQIRVSDPISAYLVLRKIKANDPSQIDISCSVAGQRGSRALKFSREQMPLSDFLRIFGLSISSVSKYLE